MRTHRLLLATALLACALLAAPARAQLPPHVPGTVCYTPQGWCWAVYAGPPGARCACPAPNGYWIQGVLV